MTPKAVKEINTIPPEILESHAGTLGERVYFRYAYSDLGMPQLYKAVDDKG